MALYGLFAILLFEAFEMEIKVYLPPTTDDAN